MMSISGLLVNTAFSTYSPSCRFSFGIAVGSAFASVTRNTMWGEN
jgi:hypothetical protein